jgi:hypothetical protein
MLNADLQCSHQVVCLLQPKVRLHFFLPVCTFMTATEITVLKWSIPCISLIVCLYSPLNVGE